MVPDTGNGQVRRDRRWNGCVARDRASAVRALGLGLARDGVMCARRRTTVFWILLHDILLPYACRSRRVVCPPETSYLCFRTVYPPSSEADPPWRSLVDYAPRLRGMGCNWGDMGCSRVNVGDSGDKCTQPVSGWADRMRVGP